MERGEEGGAGVRVGVPAGGRSAGSPTQLPEIKIREEEKHTGPLSRPVPGGVAIFCPSRRNLNPSLLWRKQTQLWKSRAIRAPASLAGVGRDSHLPFSARQDLFLSEKPFVENVEFRNLLQMPTAIVVQPAISSWVQEEPTTPFCWGSLLQWSRVHFLLALLTSSGLHPTLSTSPVGFSRKKGRRGFGSGTAWGGVASGRSS